MYSASHSYYGNPQTIYTYGPKNRPVSSSGNRNTYQTDEVDDKLQKAENDINSSSPAILHTDAVAASDDDVSKCPKCQNFVIDNNQELLEHVVECRD